MRIELQSGGRLPILACRLVVELGVCILVKLDMATWSRTCLFAGR